MLGRLLMDTQILRMLRPCNMQFGLKVNLDKTKAMIFNFDDQIILPPSNKRGKWSCAVCGRNTAFNSAKCIMCKHWTHQRCLKLRKPFIPNDTNTLKCAVCQYDQLVGPVTNCSVEIVKRLNT